MRGGRAGKGEAEREGEKRRGEDKGKDDGEKLKEEGNERFPLVLINYKLCTGS